MITWWLISAIVALLGYLYYFKSRDQRPGIPEGIKEAPIEKGWPIIGILPKIQKPLCHYLLKLGEKHGDLYRVRFGLRDIYVLNSYDVIKKCLKDDGENFSGRWNGQLMKILGKESGVLFMDGDVWAKHRAFMINVIRDFGLSSSRTSDIVQEECRLFVQEIESALNQPLNFSKIIPIYIINIVSKFIMNKRYHINNVDLTIISNFVDQIILKVDNVQNFHFLFPFWDNSYILSTFSILVTLRKRMFDEIYSLFRKEIRHHETILNVNIEGQDFIDRFLKEQSKKVNETGSVETFTEFQLIRSSLELFIAGYETTATTLVWSLLFLSRHQDIQRKMHDEIVELIGCEELPSMNEKRSLPFTQAVMDEIMRLSSAVPLSIIHRNFNDTVINGIFIEKNSIIFPNLYACHRDARVWTKPFEFYPEHFLVTDSDGTLKYNPREELIPFSLGRRQCLGETLARSEYFIFLVAIIQRFRVKFAEDVSEEIYQRAVLGTDGGIRFSSIKNYLFEKYV